MKTPKPQQPRALRTKPFNFLQGDGGNAMVLGSTRAGKSVMPAIPTRQGMSYPVIAPALLKKLL